MTREHGSKLVLVEMPMPARHRSVFYSTQAWSILRERLQKLAADSDLLYISAADWVTNDNEFEDVTHLNEVGAKDFSTRLAQELGHLPRGSLRTASKDSHPKLTSLNAQN
jgi:hypothetical protein